MANIILGKVGLTPKGSWDNNIKYEKLDIVQYDGDSYIAKTGVPVGTSITTGTEYWQPFTKKGNGTSPVDIISTSSTQPTIGDNRLWIKEENNEEYTVLTIDDINDIAGENDTNTIWSADKSHSIWNYQKYLSSFDRVEVLSDIQYEQGGIYSSGGKNNDNKKRVRTPRYTVRSGIFLTIPDDMYAYLVYYDDENKLKQYTGTLFEGDLFIYPYYSKVIICFKYKNENNISPNALTNVNIIRYYKNTEYDYASINNFKQRLEKGGINSNGSVTTPNDIRCRSINHISFINIKSIQITINDGYQCKYVAFYKNTNEVYYNSIYYADNILITNNPELVYKFVFRKSDDSDITFIEALENIKFTLIPNTENNKDIDIIARNNNSIKMEWKIGNIDNSTGGNLTSSNKIRTKNYLFTTSLNYLYINCPVGWKYKIMEYIPSEPIVYDNFIDWSSENQIIPHKNNYIYRFVLAKIDDINITIEDLPLDFEIIPSYLPYWSNEAKGNSIATFTTIRNNPIKVAEIVNIANTYYNHRNDKYNNNYTMVYSQSDTIIDNDTYTNHIDCSTYVGLILRGIPYEKTSFHTHVAKNHLKLIDNDEYTWSINPYYYKNIRDKNDSEPSVLRTASQLAEWMIQQGKRVPLDASLVNINAGDIIFWTKQTSLTPNKPSRFMEISHTAICTDKIRVSLYDPAETYSIGDAVEYNKTLYSCIEDINIPENFNNNKWEKIYDTWDINIFPYYHIITESVSTTPTINKRILERFWETPDITNVNCYNTIACACRLDLL